MFRYFYSLILFLFVFCSDVMAQSPYFKEINGRVLSATKDVEAIHILNKTSNKATITNAKGDFSIPVRINDTLLISGVQFHKKEMLITTKLLAQTTIYITLIEKVNELDEIVVRPYNLSGNIASDELNAKTDDIVTASTMGLPGANVILPPKSQRMLNSATSGFGIGTLINAISGRTKMLKKRVALERENRIIAEVSNNYDKKNLSIQSGIAEEKMDDFIFFCANDPDFYTIEEKKDELMMLAYLLEKIKQYKKENNIK